MKTIYLDMDGVLYNLNLAMQEVVKLDKLKKYKTEEFRELLREFVQKGGFSLPGNKSQITVNGMKFFRGENGYSMPFLESFRSLARRSAETREFTVEILTSHGSFMKDEEGVRRVFDQKRTWLNMFQEFKPLKMNLTSSGEEKSEFAHSDALLIDDLPENCAAFERRSGKSFIYNPKVHSYAMQRIESFLSEMYPS